MKKLAYIFFFVVPFVALHGYPIKAICGARDAIAVEENEDIQFPYATEGLIYMLDAVWNGGIGVHQEGEMTDWRELVSDTDLPCKCTAYDTFVLSDVRQTLSYVLDEPIEVSELTVEVICDKSKSTIPQQDIFIRCNDNIYYGATRTGYNTAWPGYYFLGGGNMWGWPFPETDGYIQYYYSITGRLGDGRALYYQAGKYMGARNMSMSQCTLKSWFSTLSAGTRIMAIRIYSRALSQKEIVDNYKADAERFGL